MMISNHISRVDSIVIAENDVGWKRKREIVASRTLDIK